MTGIFLSLGRLLPDRYPLRGELPSLRGGGARLRAVPRHRDDPAAPAPRCTAGRRRELGRTARGRLVDGDVPAYAWDAAHDEPWNQPPSLAARAALRLILPHRGAAQA